MKQLAALFLALSATSLVQAQTALDHVPPYTAEFGQGMNFGWYQNWTDQDLASLSAGSLDGTVEGIGVNAIRPGLFAWFLEQHGYNIRTDAFAYYGQLGMRDNVAIMGFPSDGQRSTQTWCTNGGRSKLFEGMWEPIWDNNHGTPYNEDNTYAAYMYKAVEVYGDNVSFWEIWNEPDLNYSGHGWLPRGEDGNWWENDPDPCELRIQAPVQAYVRMLRISYEVIKHLQPDDYVAIGGIGYPSFLDAVLRHTDEKTSGAVTAAHPLTGGAYFDALSFHVYPHVEDTFREWNNDAHGWDYTRNSDVAVAGVERKWKSMDDVLSAKGFDGNTYPAKVWLCTESNLPRQGFDVLTAANASVEMQRNFILKVLARAQQWGHSQFHPYQLADNEPWEDADFEYDLMGFYPFIDDLPHLDDAHPTQTGIGYRSYGKLLRGAKYSASLTDDLDLPLGAEGVGFRLPSGKTGYLLWARTTQDGNEYPQINYHVKGELRNGKHRVADWDYSTTHVSVPVTQNIQLSGTPVFVMHESAFSGISSDTSTRVLSALEVWPNPVQELLLIKLPPSDQAYELALYDATGRRATLAGAQQIYSGGVHELDLSQLVPGHYVLRATNGAAAQSTALVKQ